MLESTAHVTEIGRAAQHVAVSLEHVGRRDGQRRPPHHLHALNLGIGGAGKHRLEHLLHKRRRSVVDDQQRLALLPSPSPTTSFMFPRATLFWSPSSNWCASRYQGS